MKEYIVQANAPETIACFDAHNAPELIRCKDCRHRDPEDHKCDCGHDIQWQLPRADDWFCADGERKSADEKLMEEMDADQLG